MKPQYTPTGGESSQSPVECRFPNADAAEGGGGRLQPSLSCDWHGRKGGLQDAITEGTGPGSGRYYHIGTYVLVL